MPTGTKAGLTPSRLVGSAPDNGGLNSYPIASGYATSLGLGDPVKLSSGNIVLASNDSNDSIGVFMGVKYTDSNGEPQFAKRWVASTTGTDIEALVDDNPNRIFTVKGEGPIPLVQRGDIFALNLTSPDANTGRSTVTAKVLAEAVGATDLSAIADLGAEIATITDTDTFTVRTTAAEAGDAVTITIEDGDSPTDLVTKLSAVSGVTAALDATTGFLEISATDGYDLVLADGTGTPLNDSDALPAAGTHTGVVAAAAGLVKVVGITDTATYELEVVLVDHDLRDDG
jgi:hypothetical protein